MTRIRFIEWLFAMVLVVAVHGVALTGWAWIAPDSTGGVRLPPKTEANADVEVAAVPLVVKVSGEDTGATPVATGQSGIVTSSPPAASSSNEIIVVPTTPSVPDNSGQSTVVLAKPDLAPPQPGEEPREAAEELTDTAEPAQEREASPAAGALQLPTLDEQPGDRAPERTSALRDPVPVPKARPDAGAGAAPPPEPPSAESTTTETPGTVASAEPGQPPATGATASSEPFSAAQSTYYRRLLADIRKAQIYPDDARRENKEGTVYMQIVVERTGRIKSYDIVKSSGFHELDDAAVQSLVRANPVTPFPAEIGESELRFGLPMRFGS